MAKIHVLDKEVSELIAAGEVVERPSSVIKELVENAIDAGASAITVEIKHGGIAYMRVSDNGSGIDRAQAAHAFLRHATSKITSKEDLYQIATMGFRGEALAAISAVSKIEALTRTAEETAGIRLCLEGGEVMSSEDAGCPKGTTMIVRELFYNTPARLKFLKKDATEAAQVSALLDMLALANANIAFTFLKDGKRVLSTPGDGNLQNAAYAVLGKNIAANLLPVSYEYDMIRVHGYIGKPVLARPNRKMEILFLNGRYLRSHIYTAALEAAYKNSITIGKYPVALLHLDMPAHLVDINVHPAKMEAKFAAERTVFDAVFFAAKNALSAYQAREQIVLPNDKPLSPAVREAGGEKLPAEVNHHTAPLTFSKQGEDSLSLSAAKKETVLPDDARRADALISDLIAADKKKEPTDLLYDVLDHPPLDTSARQAAHLTKTARKEPAVTAEDTLRIAQDASLYQVPYQSRADGYQALAGSMGASAQKPSALAKKGEEGPVVPDEGDCSRDGDRFAALAEGMKSARLSPAVSEDTASPRQNSIIEAEGESPRPEITLPGFDQPTPARVVGEVFQTYIILEAGDQMLLIDKHAAHERMLYEKLRASQASPDSQVLLEPVIVDLTKDEFSLVFEHLPLIKRAGFYPEEFGAGAVVLREVPTILDHRDVAAAFIQMLDAIGAYKSEEDIQILDRILYSMACRAAVKAGDAVDIREITALAEQWLCDGNIKYCPHGRPVCISMEQKYLEKQFKRIQ